MTALCGGGSSGPKPGVAETIIFTTGALASLLNNKGALWAVLAAPLLGVVAYQATELCSTDPPPAPTITAAEYQALLELQPWATLTSALGKLAQLAKLTVWFEMCACTSIATPTPSASTFAPPAGVTAPIVGTSCPQPRARLSFPQVGTPIDTNQNNITRLLFPGLPTYTGSADGRHAAQDVVRIDPSWTSWRLHLDLVSSTGGSGDAGEVELSVYNSNLQILTGTLLSVGVDSAVQHDVDPNTGPLPIDHTNFAYFSVNAWKIGAPATAIVADLAMDINCADTGAQVPCCPPDQGVINLLGQIMGMVTTMQRQHVPFGVIHGAVHTIAEGTSSLSISRLLGLDIQVLTIPEGKRELFGQPPYVMDLGWISVSDQEAMLQEIRITRNVQRWLPTDMQLATNLGIALQPGVTARVTELLVEPA